MKKNLLTLCITLGLSAAAFAGVAAESKFIQQPEPEIFGGPYIAPFGGVNLYQNEDIAFGSLDPEVGWFAGLKIGYLFRDPGLFKPAVELEGFYNGVESDFNNLLGTDVDFSADFHSANIMLNLIGKWDLGTWQPYLGMGLGAAHVWLDNPEFEVGDTTFEGSDDSEWSFAYQGIAGIDYRITERFTVFAEYKALVYNQPVDLDGQYLHHLLGIGLRFGF